jgi:hypothetical protein
VAFEQRDKYDQSDAESMAARLPFDQDQAALVAFVSTHGRLGTRQAFGLLGLAQAGFLSDGQEQVL